MKVAGWLRHPHADLAMAGIVYVATVVTTHDGHLDWVAAVACLPLMFRRRYPFTAFLVSAVFAEVFLVLHAGRQDSLVLAAPLIALYTMAESSSRRRALTVGMVAVFAFAGLHILARPASFLGADNLALAALGGLAVAAGDAARSRREYLAEVEARARHAEQDRDAEAVRRVTDERLRIARDLHDVVGHQLALINVQAGVAAHVLDAQPVQARAALGHIRQASKVALGELRDTIGLLRQAGDQPVPTEPVVGLSGLPGLLTEFRRSGLVIDEEHTGDPGRIAVAADLTAYRVIQEALTNVCRHAGKARVTVSVHCAPEVLDIMIENQKPPLSTVHPAPTSGHGIVGMRERVAALGGSLSAGPRPEGGFRVTARLPL